MSGLSKESQSSKTKRLAAMPEFWVAVVLLGLAIGVGLWAGYGYWQLYDSIKSNNVSEVCHGLYKCMNGNNFSRFAPEWADNLTKLAVANKTVGG